MDLNGYRFLIFIELTIDSISIMGSVTPFYSETYNGYTLIMPLTDNDTRIPLTVNASFAKRWCSSINSSLPRITNESDERNIVDFIRNATRKYQFAGIENMFLNNIYHTVGNWTWVNGQIEQGLKEDNKAGYFFGCLNTKDFGLWRSRQFEPRKYICETPEQSSNSSLCEMKLGNRCYWKKDVNILTWYKARESCFNEGGDLASFVKFYERNPKVALKDLGLNANTSYWVGLSKSVWRWNDKDPDSEIKYSNWKTNHPSNYNATCLCLNKQPNKDYEWIECDCDKSYPFICKRNESDVLSATVMHVLLPTISCLTIVVIAILIVAVFVIRKQRNRPMNSSHDVTSEAKLAETTNDPSLYAEIQKLRERQSSTKCSESSTTYTTLQFDPKTKQERPREEIVYAEVDLIPKA